MMPLHKRIDKKNSIMQQVVQSYVVLVSFALIVFLVGVMVTYQYKKQSTEIVQKKLPNTLQMLQISSDVHQVLAALRGWISIEDEVLRSEGRNVWNQLIGQDLNRLELQINRTNNSALTQQFERLKTDLIKLREWHWYIEEAAQNAGNKPAHLLNNTLLLTSFNSCKKLIMSLSKKDSSVDWLALLAEIAEIQNSVAEFLQTATQDDFMAIRERTALFEQDLLKRFSHELKSELKNENAELVRELLAFSALAKKVIALRNRPDWNKANYWLTTEAIPLSSSIKENLATMTSKYKDMMNIGVSELDKLGLTLFWSISIIIVFIVGFALAHGRFWISTIIRPIKLLAEASTELRKGKLDQEITWERNDEFGDLALSFELMRRSLKKRERDLRSSKIRLDTIIQSVIDAVVVVNHKGLILSANKPACLILDTKEHLLLGDKFFHFIKNAHENGILRHVGNESVICANDNFVEVVAMRQHGETFAAEVAIKEMLIAEERQYVALLRDISERKAVDVAKAEFLSVVSHELRTPLTSIRGSIGLLHGGVIQPMNDKALSMLEIAMNNTERLLKLINDMLDIERLESGNIHLTKSWVPISTLIEEAIANTTELALDKNIRISLDQVDEVKWEVFVDPDRMIQVINNLLSNAIKHSAESDIVKVTAERYSSNQIKVAIIDHGPGIPKSFQPLVFHKFSQADTSATRQVQGTGLGLCIAKRIVEQHYGNIGFNTGAAGTEFFFILDLRAKTASGIQLEKKVAKHKLLICDDEEDIATLLKYVASEAGFESDVCLSYEQAKSKLATNKYDALFLDVFLGEKNGLELLEQIRTLALPTVIISGKAEKSQYVDVIEKYDIYQWLSKPINVLQVGGILGKIKQDRSKQVLYVEKDGSMASIFSSLLGDDIGFQLVQPQTAKDLVKIEKYQLIVLDVDISLAESLELIDLIQVIPNDPPPTILLTEMEVPVTVQRQMTEILLKSEVNSNVFTQLIESYVN
jgi:PAS domain S-box-containing protein